jgi:hypothetical protein
MNTPVALPETKKQIIHTPALRSTIPDSSIRCEGGTATSGGSPRCFANAARGGRTIAKLPSAICSAT